ncbi:MAG: TlpA disulfide reductase family protein [Gammaproteobacteria bacterium]
MRIIWKQSWLVIAVVLLTFTTGSQAAQALKGPATDFTLKSRDGKNIKLSELRGQVVMINFWASWCGPCRQEMPLLEDIHNKYSALGFTLLGVNVEEDSSKANAYLRDVSVTFPILYDTKNSVSKAYNISAMPSTVMVDRDGNLRYLHHGYKPGYEKEYEKQIKALIRE